MVEKEIASAIAGMASVEQNGKKASHLKPAKLTSNGGDCQNETIRTCPP